MVEAPLSVVLVQNDFLHAEDVTEVIKHNFPGVQVTNFSTEHELQDKLPEISLTPPNIFVIGFWVRWTFPNPHMPDTPADWEATDEFRGAGARMATLISHDPTLANIPVILMDTFSEERMRDQFIRNVGPIPDSVTFLEDRGDSYDTKYQATILSTIARLTQKERTSA